MLPAIVAFAIIKAREKHGGNPIFYETFVEFPAEVVNPEAEPPTQHALRDLGHIELTPSRLGFSYSIDFAVRRRSYKVRSAASKIGLRHSMAREPLMRTIARAAPPGAEAIAQIVSSRS